MHGIKGAGCQQHLLLAASTRSCKHVGASVFVCLVQKLKDGYHGLRGVKTWRFK